MRRSSRTESQQGGYQESGTMPCTEFVKTSEGKEALIPDS